MRTLPTILLLIASAGLCGPRQAAGAPAPAAAPNAPASGLAGVVAPRLPVLRSPIAQFRELLAMTPAERGPILAARPEPQRSALRSKLAEYEALPQAEREARLRVTELRWYLRPLMDLPPASRPIPLRQVPEEYIGLVRERLDQWDALTPGARAELLENESALRHFARLRDRTAPAPASRTIAPGATTNLPPTPGEAQRRLESQIASFRTLPTARQQLLCARFEQFFELPAQERQKTLRTLNDAELRQMEKTLADFGNLPSAQRRVCVNSFQKLAGMSSEERSQFLKSADRWKEMTPGERAAWRGLVSHHPPSPPGLGEPPLPPPLRQSPSAPRLPGPALTKTNASLPSNPPAPTPASAPGAARPFGV